MDRRTITWAKDQLNTRAGEDPEFRAALIADPLATAEKMFGQPLPPEIKLHVHEDTPTEMHLVLDPPGPTRDSTVTLREISRENVRAVTALEVKPEQKNFVAANAISLSEALVQPKAWYRAIYADDTPVGFVMLMDDPETPRYYLWRYMVGGEYQGFGFGKRALQQVIDYVRSRPRATEFSLSYVPGEGSPREFYRSLGFEDTGVTHGPENEMKLVL